DGLAARGVGLAARVVRGGRRDARDALRVAGRPAVQAGLALALQADARAVLDTCGELDRVAPRPPLAAAALAAVARLLDHGAVAATARTGLRQREEALRLGLHAAPVALGADDRNGSGLRAGPAA